MQAFGWNKHRRPILVVVATMKFLSSSLLLLASTPYAAAFSPALPAQTGSVVAPFSTQLEAVAERKGLRRVLNIFGGKRKTMGDVLREAGDMVVAPATDAFAPALEAFPGALTNAEFATMVTETLTQAGYDASKTLVATSLCCDEVNRPLETTLAETFDTNFNMGGLAGFPFGGKTSFGAMAAHIPDGGSCAVVFGPHVGVDHDGSVGTVERRGRAQGGACCGSAVAASGYVSGVLNGAQAAGVSSDALDAQQSMVGELLLPYAARLEKAGDDKMSELPRALYEAQSSLMGDIVSGAAGGVSGKIVVIGGIQINTPPAYSDYFLPLEFSLVDNTGKVVEDLMPGNAIRPFEQVQKVYPGAITNAELVKKIKTTLSDKGYDLEKTLVATSLCCDEVNRPLETDLSAAFDTNFQMGGLAGFPFGGATSFGAMASHIPDGGDCVVVYGPHVGVDSTGAAGTVERRGKESGGSCCGSAVAASGYVAGVNKGDAEKAKMPAISDAQQFFVGEALLPYADRLEKASDTMVELPLALYDAQTELMGRIVQQSAGAVAGKGKIVVVGGVQINTPPSYSDYFLPKSFQVYDNSGKLLEDNLLWAGSFGDFVCGSS